MEKVRLLRITTVPISLVTLLKGQPEFFAQHAFEILTVSADGAEVKQLKEAGIAHQIIHMTRRITPWADFMALIKLILLIRKFKPSIVHTHTPKAGLLGMMAAWICGVSVRMHTIAGLVWMESTGLKRWVLILMERFTYRLATRVYPNSFQLKEFLRATIGFNDLKTKVIANGSSNGIDADYFSKTDSIILKADEIRAQYSIASNDFIFCFIGRIVRDKGIVELVDAFESIASSHVKLILVGHQESDLDPIPASTIQKIKNDKRIIEAGYQTDVRPWLAISHAFVLPSYREGFPNVVMQASCMELPSIVSDINGCNEIVKHQQMGLLIPSKSSPILASAMRDLMSNPEDAKHMGVKARQFVSTNFSQQFVWNELLKEYQALLRSI